MRKSSVRIENLNDRKGVFCTFFLIDSMILVWLPNLFWFTGIYNAIDFIGNLQSQNLDISNRTAVVLVFESFSMLMMNVSFFI